ncbi:hypothetical protein CR983_04220 [Candidatus Saccharibacteria bacterium]|nr:MAG: hypothetical protein CR983_04220 [Candidatus Saccharibacteria bacterium]
MKFLLFEHIDTAYQSVRAHRTRSLLTVIGVAIGVASITTILSLASGVSHVVNDQVDQLDGDVALVRPGVDEAHAVDSLLSTSTLQHYSTSSLTEKDVEVIQKIQDDLAVAPLMTLTTSAKAHETTVRGITVLATTADFVQTAAIQLDEGEFIDEATTDNVAVIGTQLAIDLFGTENPIGQRFTIKNTPLTIIGVIKPLKPPINYNMVNFDRTAIVTMARGKGFNGNNAQIQQINVSAANTTKLDELLPEIERRLDEQHGERDFTIVRGEDAARPTNQHYRSIAGAMTAIAAISLIVGGIGIMNIMLVGVAERTREIGIRKAVGASDGTIVVQFLIESLLISATGGAIGYAFGLMAAFFVGALIYFTPAVNWQVAGAALGVSILVGLVFGLYPALRAARKDTIESLRQYR